MEKIIEKMKKDKMCSVDLLVGWYAGLKDGDFKHLFFIEGFLYGLESTGYLSSDEVHGVISSLIVDFC